ncbi:SH3 domain-containing protein [Mameliella sediminis]|uniref:SH3 domain-containing protein n=1 Tax=Mameliella sediminis TaxID=2836866 RepID=UPI001C4773DE|nr:SH3 domain-containing protein [Mameliella sediminis]MBV7395999.1 SH3 domain-containing protein [Mameliella sediminis]
MTRIQTLAAAALLAVASAPQVQAGDCTGWVVGVRPISQYNHAGGNGFLAVRTGPGSGYQQIGELYLGDEISVWNRSGSWYQVQCMSGRCTNPLWGAANPNGWVYGGYLNIGGVCP